MRLFQNMPGFTAGRALAATALLVIAAPAISPAQPAGSDPHAGHAAAAGAHADHGTNASPALGEVRVAFELIDAEGRPVTEADFRGKHVLLAFGFTRCTQVCPMMAFNMANALRASDREAVGAFVSVDTERDTPADTHRYAASFHDAMIGLGGSFEQVGAAARNFKVSYAVTKTQQGYTVQHTANIYLIDPQGELVDVFALTAPAADIAAAMR
jgi:protein SCO1/2